MNLIVVIDVADILPHVEGRYTGLLGNAASGFRQA